MKLLYRIWHHYSIIFNAVELHYFHDVVLNFIHKSFLPHIKTLGYVSFLCSKNFSPNAFQIIA